MTSSARAEGVRRGLRRGREERSHNPGGPSRRKRCTHLAAVLGVTLKLASASFSATPRATYSTKSSRRRRVSRAFLWMSIRSFLGNWIARHNQLLWFRSNGQRLERSQAPPCQCAGGDSDGSGIGADAGGDEFLSKLPGEGWPGAALRSRRRAGPPFPK